MPVKKTQKGVVVFGVTDTLIDVTIDSVIMDKSVVFVEVAGNGNDTTELKHTLVTAQLINETTIRLQRGYASYVSLQVHWKIIESSNWSVQRGSHDTASDDFPITINAVNLTESFIVSSYRGESFPYTLHGALLTNHFENDTTIRVRNTWGKNTNFYEYQVVTIPDAKVQSVFAYSYNEFYKDVTIANIDINKSFLIMSSQMNDVSQVCNPEIIKIGRIYDNTTVRFSAWGSGTNTQIIQFFMIETDDIISNTLGWLTLSGTSDVVSINSVDTNFALNINSGIHGSITTVNTTAKNIREYGIISNIFNPTQLEIQRNLDDSSAAVSWQALEFKKYFPVENNNLYEYYNQMRG